MKRIKLKNFLTEGDGTIDAPLQLTKEERQQFLEACKNYGTYKKYFNPLKGIDNMIADIGWIVDIAETLTLQETENWFDDVTVNRHMKQIKESYKVLQKTAGELKQSQQRFEAAYDDIGSVLGRYYEL
jgi:hypothetical protein